MAGSPFPPKILRASAGTGKTFQLTNRYLKLLLAGESGDKILAVTFSRKAAKEIEQRIFERLVRGCSSEQAAKELGAQIGFDRASRELLLSQLYNLARNQHRLRVSTLDSFFVELARLFSYELALPPEWTIYDQSRQSELQLEVVRRCLRELGGEQSHAVLEKLKRFAGRRSIEAQIAESLGQLFNLVMETDEAAWQWITPPEAPSKEVIEATIEEFRLLPVPQKKAGGPDTRFLKAINSLIQQVEQGQWEEVIANGLGGKVIEGLDSYQGKEIPAEMAEVIEIFIQAARSNILQSHKSDLEMTRVVFASFCNQFYQLLKSSGGLTFSAVTQILAESQLKDDLQLMAYRLDSKIHHLLLDEFQDTAIAQWKVLEPLAREILSKSGEDHSFFCVGDIKQAIYGWRGGVADIFDYLEESLTVETEDLSKSFRSSQVILDFANTIYSGLDKVEALESYSPVVKRWQDAFKPHSTDLDVPGYVKVELISLEPEERPDEVTQNRVVELVTEIKDSSPQADIAVLVRTNRKIPELLSALDKEGIKASDEAGSLLTSVPAVRAILSLLRFLDHPGNQIALFHIQSTPLAEILELDLNPTPEELRAQLLLNLSKTDLANWLRSICEKLKASITLQDYIALQHLTEIVSTNQRQYGSRFSPLIEIIRTKKVLQPAPGVVRVMTIHKAKGLEFDAVILPELDQSMLPMFSRFIKYQPDKLEPVVRVLPYVGESRVNLCKEYMEAHQAYLEEQIGEELSVFYVGVTRPKHALYLVSTQPKSKTKSNTPSFRAILGDVLSLEERGGQLTYEAGDPNWQQEINPPERTEQPRFIRPNSISLLEAQSSRIIRQTTPSTRDEKRITFEELLQTGDPKWARRGTLLHALCEQIEWLSDKGPEQSALSSALAPLPFLAEEKQEALTLFANLIKNEVVTSWFLKDRYQLATDEELRVYRELPFLVRLDQQIISGIIDRLVVVKSGKGEVSRVEILDFKSGGARDDLELERKTERYLPQIEAYRSAVAQIFSIDRSSITARLCFIELGKEVSC